MPIRFRCAYCNQLMGIARRKAGTVVSCPNCAGQVVVPTDDEPTDNASAGTVSPNTDTNQPLFERSDFDDLFRSGGKKPPPPPPMPPTMASPPAPPPAPQKQTMPVTSPSPAPPRVSGPLPTSAPPPPPPAPRLDFPSNLPTPAPAGFVLSPSMSTLLSVAVIVALALAFTAGLLVGRFYLQPSSDEKIDSPHLEGRLNAGTRLHG